MRGYVYDEFSKPNLAPHWWEDSSGLTSHGGIVDGRYRFRFLAGESGSGAWRWLEQGAEWSLISVYPEPGLVVAPDDFYCKYILPTGLPESGWGFNAQLWFYDLYDVNIYDGDLGAWFVFENGAQGWQWYFGGWSDWDSYGEGYWPPMIPVGNPTEAWIRLKSPPGKISQIFYALSEPKFESDWIEFAEYDPTYAPNGINEYIKPLGQAEVAFTVQGDSQYLASDVDFFIDYVRPWVDGSLHRQMIADLDDVFYNVAEFADEIIYEPRGEDPVGIRAVILGQDDVVAEPGILGDTLRIRVRSRDIPVPGRDSLIYNGRRWFVLRNAGGGPHIGEWELEISRSEQRSI